MSNQSVLVDAVAKALADAKGHGMREKCEEQARQIVESAPIDPDAPMTINPVSRVMFRAGLLACREYMARFVAAESPTIAASIRANWWPCLGGDPGTPRQLAFSEVADGDEEGPWTHRADLTASVEALPYAYWFLDPEMQAAIAAQRGCADG